jgi:hypothetical protein
MILAHVAGAPVEEIFSLAPAAALICLALRQRTADLAATMLGP